MSRPTIYVTDWDATAGHGYGRRLSITARPRSWEHGDGRVPWLTPTESDLLDLWHARVTMDEFRRRFEGSLYGLERHDHLSPGELVAAMPDGSRSVEDGDTLCCGCSRADAAAGRCHRVWAAQALARNGWRVVLDGVEVVSDLPGQLSLALDSSRRPR